MTLKKTDFFFLHNTGPALPNALANNPMAESPDGRGVLQFGGYNHNTDISDYRIFELRVGANSWNILNITLQDERSNYIVIPLQ